jgi:hypothetical protein
MAKKNGGIYADPKATATDKVLDFSYQNDVLAQLIVDIWNNLQANLITPTGPNTTPQQYQARSAAAKTVLAARGIYLVEPIVITEDEYDAAFSLADAGLHPDKAVVFVVPRQTRPVTTAGTPLLETAKMLMAITPNGI